MDARFTSQHARLACRREPQNDPLKCGLIEFKLSQLTGPSRPHDECLEIGCNSSGSVSRTMNAAGLCMHMQIAVPAGRLRAKDLATGAVYTSSAMQSYNPSLVRWTSQRRLCDESRWACPRHLPLGRFIPTPWDAMGRSERPRFTALGMQSVLLTACKSAPWRTWHRVNAMDRLLD